MHEKCFWFDTWKHLDQSERQIDQSQKQIDQSWKKLDQSRKKLEQRTRLRRRMRSASGSTPVQGYLAHKKPPPRRTLQ